ncbi:hypothetical protein BH10ACT6_BH10ACT6_09820 [soil metagenome]
MQGDTAALARVAIASSVTELSISGAPPEMLAEYLPPHRSLLVPRRAAFVTIGPVWRLGVLLLGVDGALFATGSVTRARNPTHPNYTSVSGEERRERREAARRAGFALHDTVNFDALPLPFDTTLGTVGPLRLRDGALVVSWNGSGTADSLRPFAAYLHERVELLAHPPEGA